jgi:hypothetical protein
MGYKMSLGDMVAHGVYGVFGGIWWLMEDVVALGDVVTAGWSGVLRIWWILGKWRLMENVSAHRVL